MEGWYCCGESSLASDHWQLGSSHLTVLPKVYDELCLLPIATAYFLFIVHLTNYAKVNHSNLMKKVFVYTVLLTLVCIPYPNRPG